MIKSKILLLSTGDVNGAYEYVYRLATLFVQQGHQVVMLVKNKTKSDLFLVQYKQNQLYSFRTIIKRGFSKIQEKYLRKE